MESCSMQPLRLAFFTQHNSQKIGPGCPVYGQFTPFDGEQHPGMCIYHREFNHAPVEEHLGCLQC